MKNLKKILALVIVMSIITVMGLTAFTLSAAGSGVSITITRDPSAAGQSGSGPMNDYYYYKIFDASYESNTTTTPNGGVDASGTAQLGSGTATAVAYTATKDVVDAFNGTTDDKGVVTTTYFKFTPIASSIDTNGDPTLYSVDWIGDKTADRVQGAANEIKSKLVDTGEISGEKLEYVDGKWSKDNLTKGYYLIVGATGKNLIAATTDIDINEKNTYPDLHKSGTDNDGNSGTSLNVAIGQKIDYVVTVDVPATAIGKFKVTDSASKGLKLVPYSDGKYVKAYIGTTEDTSISATANADLKGWEAEFIVTEDNKATYQGNKVQFKYTMEVTEDALVDTQKKNTPSLEYGSGTTFIPVPPEVKYKTYFTGIEKVDLDDSGTKLDGVKFVLKQSSGSQMVEFPVTLSGSYYYPDPNGSAEVITGSGTKGTGVIIIRGLDDDKDYTLTETETLTGYNLLSDPLPLTLVLDSGTAYSTTTFEKIGNAKGSLLPSTGGIGTTIFYVVGAVLVIGTGVVLVTRRRMGNAD